MRAWLKELRYQKKLSMAEVAAQASISQSYYSDSENGKRGYHVPVHTSKAIASVLDFPWEWFYEEIPKDASIRSWQE